MRKPKRQREKFVIDVDSLDQEGRGVGRREGKVVFIEGALPEEQIECECYRSKDTFELGICTEIYKESPLRVKPECSYFGVKDGSCGGCALQHLEAHAQVAMKQKVLLDALWHIGKVKPQSLLSPIYGPTWGYRHRGRLSVKDVAKKAEALIGFHEKRSSFICDMKSCKILPDSVSNLLVPLRQLVGSLSLRKKIPQIEFAVTEDCVALVFRILEPLTAEDEKKLRDFQENTGAVIWLQTKGPETVHPMDPENWDCLKLRHHQDNVTITFRPIDFTQVNHEVNEVMVSRALEKLVLTGTEKVVDFFCGLGNFTLPIARHAAVVHGIEGSQGLVDRATVAAKDNGLSEKVAFSARNLFDWSVKDWETIYSEMQGIDRILIDPPREGAMALCESLAATENRPERIVYVSCNPSTLARDAGILVNKGGWSLVSCGVMNMFPHTSHVESLAVFVKKSDGRNSKTNPMGMS